MIGRELETKELRKKFDSDQSEFVAVYGRRRIGKTFLVNEVFHHHFAFHHAGMENGDRRTQLASFREAIKRQGLSKCPPLKTWVEAFAVLGDLLDRKQSGKKVVFLDELPWYDTPKSGFLSAFESFWNGWASLRNDILLVICGSSTSWIVNKVLRNRGGLHNRITKRIPLHPFTLRECEAYAEYKHLGFDRHQLLECYMAFGGVAYYWSLLEEGKSAAQNLDRLCFAESGELREEFDSVFQSLFKTPTRHYAIINLFGVHKAGLTREEVIKGLGEGSSGEISDCLDELVECGFLRRYCLPRHKKSAVYQLIDNFTLFHFKFLRNRTGNDNHFWSISHNKPGINAWKGLAFERICMQHIEQIKRALGISGILSDVYSWRSPASGKDEPGAQIDMLIDRDDRIINLCEIKFSEDEYALDETEEKKLRYRLELFKKTTKTRKGVNVTIITAYGLKHNKHSCCVQSEVTLDDLFC